MKMKRICIRAVWALLLAVLLCGTAAAEEITAWGSVREDKAVLCLPGESGQAFTCQIGSAEAKVRSVKPLSELETPVETVVLLDNSLSIQKAQRPVIRELLGDLIANRLPGEQYTIATISDQVDYLCTAESNYAALKSIVDQLEFRDQNTQLTDGLYSVISGLKEKDDGLFRRVLIIADGVDNKQIGCTQSELAALIQETGYPIYTVGCTNTSASATEELQNLFALSRLTSGASYYLQEVEDTLDIVSGVTAWNNSVQLEVRLPAEVCDGLPKALRITSKDGSAVYTLELKMPLAELTVSREEPEPEPEPDGEPDREEEPQQTQTEDGLPLVLIAAAAAVVLVVILVTVVVLRKKNRVEEVPDLKPLAGAATATELLSPVDADAGRTEGIWGAGPVLRLLFQDADVPSRRVEVILDGEVLVGRDASACQVVLTEPSVARKQCRIFRQGGCVMVENLSHSNITKLNDRAVTEPWELTSGSVLQMGRLRMRVDILQL